MIKLGLNAVGLNNKAYLGTNLVFDPAPVPTPIPQDDLIIDLNADTMFTTGGVLATEGQKIVNWGNAVTGNSVTGASNPLEDGQPVLKVTLEGIKEVDFSASENYRLSLGQHPEIDWRNPSANYTIIMQSGDSNNSVYWISNLNNQTSENGSMAMDFYNNRFYYHDGGYWRSVAHTIPTVSTVVTLTREQFPGLSKGYVNNIQRISNATVNFANNTTTRDLIIGNTNNNTAGFAYGGTLRRVLIWNRVLTETEMTNVYNYLIDA